MKLFMGTVLLRNHDEPGMHGVWGRFMKEPSMSTKEAANAIIILHQEHSVIKTRYQLLYYHSHSSLNDISVAKWRLPNYEALYSTQPITDLVNAKILKVCRQGLNILSLTEHLRTPCQQ
jgi:hypothetical protein